MKKRPHRLKVLGIVLDEKSGDPYLMLENPLGGPALSFALSPGEAVDLIPVMEGIHPSLAQGPSLSQELMGLGQLELQSATIFRRANGDHGVRLQIRRGLRKSTLDCRLGEGVALALGSGLGLFAEEKLLQAPVWEQRNKALLQNNPQGMLHLSAEPREAFWLPGDDRAEIL